MRDVKVIVSEEKCLTQHRLLVCDLKIYALTKANRSQEYFDICYNHILCRSFPFDWITVGWILQSVCAMCIALNRLYSA